MSTKAVTVQLPSSLAQVVEAADLELVAEILHRGFRDWRVEKALDRYVAGELSFGAAAEESGLSQSELSRHAYARGMTPPFSEETLAEEIV